MPTSKARLVTDPGSQELSSKSQADSQDPQAVVDTLLSVARCSDAAAKRILHTFRCPCHLIPWKGGSKTEDHFLNSCPVISHKHKCEHIPQGRRNEDAEPRARRAAHLDDAPQDTETPEADDGEWTAIPSQTRGSSPPAPSDPSLPFSPTCSNPFTALQITEPVESMGGRHKGTDKSNVSSTVTPNLSFPSRTCSSQRKRWKQVTFGPSNLPSDAVVLPHSGTIGRALLMPWSAVARGVRKTLASCKLARRLPRLWQHP